MSDGSETHADPDQDGVRVFVWDTTGPLHAARCSRSDVLHDAAGPRRRHVVTDQVVNELVLKGFAAPAWAETCTIDSLEGLIAFGLWSTRVETNLSTGHNVGEAATLAWAELNSATAIIDDKDASRVAKRYRAQLLGDPAIVDANWCVHGTLWAVAREVVDERKDSPKACAGFCDQMLGTGINWPFGPGGYPAWFERHRDTLFSSCCLT